MKIATSPQRISPPSQIPQTSGFSGVVVVKHGMRLELCPMYQEERETVVLMCMKRSAGRYYASTVLKLVLSHVLLNYDCELLNKEGARTMWWRSAIVPLSTTVVTFRPRLLEK